MTNVFLKGDERLDCTRCMRGSTRSRCMSLKCEPMSLKYEPSSEPLYIFDPTLSTLNQVYAREYAKQILGAKDEDKMIAKHLEVRPTPSLDKAHNLTRQGS